MGIKETLGLSTEKKVRYAVVGLGDISQGAMLPGVKHTGNSELVALVTSDAEKAQKVGEQYGVSQTYTYGEFETLLRSGTIDAIYLATPNWRHAEFVIPALKAGIHVLVEKPLEISMARCQEIMDVQKATGTKLMVAYRLHFEPATLSLIKKIRAGELGDVHFFTSTFSQMVDPANHRAKNGDFAGPVFDMGPYPVNASRYVFGAEPVEVVSAVGTRHPQSGLGDFDDTVAVSLRFPEGRLAQFVVSYYGAAIDSYTVVGTKGQAVMNPGFTYGKSLEQTTLIDKEKNNESFKNTDQFGGEMKYFSECILKNIEPEPNAEEGYADVRVIEGIMQALKTGGSVPLKAFTRQKRIDPGTQEQRLGPKKAPELVNTKSPAKDMEKHPTR